MSSIYESWGRFPRVTQSAYSLSWRDDKLPSDKTILPFGLGRSYGDVCLNAEGYLLLTRGLNRFIAFDPKTGILRCEAGVSFAEILSFSIPLGWFLPVTPGTKFVTVGGAIANDVHGKNHHRAGTFGHYIRSFELRRSDGNYLHCTTTENPQWYNATLGGLGLTGLITSAEIQLKPIHNAFIQAEVIQFKHVEEFFELSSESEKNYEYTVAWIDCNAQDKSLGRGLFSRGNHAHPDIKITPIKPKKSFTMPIDLPSFALNRFSIQVFNYLYYHKQRQIHTHQLLNYDPFFYPLDSILQWNRLYGKRGFLQYQCVVPDNDINIIKKILKNIAQSGAGSFLAVLKTFGEIPSRGMLSFPCRGVTLALDFPIKGAETFALLTQLDEQVQEVGGRVYPCKDARMSARHFQQYYPQWETFTKYIDPHFSSSFWRRVTRNK